MIIEIGTIPKIVARIRRLPAKQPGEVAVPRRWW
jgi:hypothetical protein